MSTYLPTVELTPAIEEAVAAGTLRLQTGQWVCRAGVAGRVIQWRHCAGMILFRRPGESFPDYQARFRAVCREPFRLQPICLPKVPVAARCIRPRGTPVPRLASTRPFFRIRARCDNRTRALPLDSVAPRHRTRPALRVPVPSWRIYQEVPHGYVH